MTTMDIPVSLFAMKYKKDSTEISKIYENLLKIKSDYTSIAAAGNEDDADRVRIKGSLEENLFTGQDGNIVSYTKIRGSFVNRISKDECGNYATFGNVIVIGKMKEEVKGGEPTGKLKVDAVSSKYDGSVDVLHFIVSSSEAIDYMQSHYNEGDTVEVAGIINYSSRIEQIQKEVGFGAPIVERKTISTRELIITSGSEEPFDEDKAYSKEDITKELTKREARIEEILNNNKKPQKEDFKF